MKFTSVCPEYWYHNVPNRVLQSHNPNPKFVQSKVLARRVSSCPMDAHFWKKYKQNSLHLL